jgi:predicted permease
MAILVDVVTQITLPVVLLAAAGFGLQKWARFDVTTLNRFLVYGTFPCYIVVTLSRAEIPVGDVQGPAAFLLVQFLVLLGIGWLVARAMGVARELRGVLALGCAFPNSGNYGIPVIELAFGGDMVFYQVVITAVYAAVIMLAAPLIYGETGGSLTRHVKALFANPMLPAVVLGLGLNALNLRLPQVIETPAAMLGEAYIGVALVALGAQLGASSARVPLGAASTTVGLRLLLAPVLTAAAVLLLPFSDQVAGLLIVGACAPVGMLVAIFAAEFRGHASLAAAAVMASTVLSPFVTTLALVLLRL